MRYNRCMEVEWKDFVKCSQANQNAVAAQPSVKTVKQTGKNNPFNMRHYLQGWLGEDSSGLGKGDMLNFSSPYYGWRAGARNARNILLRLKESGKTPTIRNFTPIYSPKNGDFKKNENNVKRHMKNISSLSRIGLDDEINPDDETQLFKFLTGLAMSESGFGSLNGMKAKDILRAIRSGKKSVKK